MKDKNRQILITGGCGFVGANLVKYLLDKDYNNIVVYDDLSTGSFENMKKAIADSQKKGMVSLIEGNILDKEKLEKSIKDCDIIVHMAAHTRVVESLENPSKNFEINVIGTFNVLETSRKNNIKRFIFASSNAAVGEQIPPLNESMIPKPISPYGASKLIGESLCTAYFHTYGLFTVSLRFSNVYGPYSEHKTSVIAKFIRRSKAGNPLEIYGDGEQTRDFIHSQDICQAIYLALNNENIKQNIAGEIFQIGTGIETKINDLADMIKDMAISSGFEMPYIVHRDKQRGEIKKNYVDIRKAEKVLGFKPAITLNSGIKEIFLQ